jgi:hypothetical protein
MRRSEPLWRRTNTMCLSAAEFMAALYYTLLVVAPLVSVWSGSRWACHLTSIEGSHSSSNSSNGGLSCILKTYESPQKWWTTWCSSSRLTTEEAEPR